MCIAGFRIGAVDDQRAHQGLGLLTSLQGSE